MVLTTSRRTTKIRIPHTIQQGVDLVGVLEQVEPEGKTEGRKIALILHGTMGHKDYVYQKRLGSRLPIDSFRFDFRGNCESGGVWKQAKVTEDVEDLSVVAVFLSTHFGYRVDLVVAHSRGSNAAMHWCSTTDEGRKISAFVNVSGRYRMEKMAVNIATYAPSFAERGYYDWHIKIAGKPFVGRIYPGDTEECMQWDTSPVWDHFPGHIDILTLHGLADVTVPPYDAVIWARAFGGRQGLGTHNLAFVENADHNYVAPGCREEVIETILRWWDMHEKNTLRTGIWSTGSKYEPNTIVSASPGGQPTNQVKSRL